MEGTKSKEKRNKDKNVSPSAATLGRRDVIKLGVGAGVGASLLAVSQLMNASAALPQDGEAGPAQGQKPVSGPSGVIAQTEVGWTNNANRAFGNGPMDRTSQQIVEYVSSFSESNLTPSVIEALHWNMIDSIAALIAGFESEPARICARMAQARPAGDLKSTVLGYGVSTTPEQAAFANSSMIRHCDYNDSARGGHVSTITPGILAVAEAVHATGAEALAAIAIGYEISGANLAGNGGGWDQTYEGIGTAMAAGKLLGLNQDLLANALSLTLVPHMPMRASHVGALSMWKACHEPELVRCGVWGALMARAGMTGPCEPFEGRQGLWDHLGAPTTPLLLPARSDGHLNVESAGFKRYPSEISTQAFQELTPEIRKLTKADDIVSILIEMPFDGWQEIGDAPKWDPRNRETADHSIPYVVARSLIDGDIYMDSFTKEKYMDPAARRLMAVTVVRPNADFKWVGRARLSVRTKSGQELVKETSVRVNTPMTHDEIIAKFNRACAYQGIANEQRDRARAQWGDLQTVKDIAEPMQTLAKFGQPKPLSDMTPARVS